MASKPLKTLTKTLVNKITKDPKVILSSLSDEDIAFLIQKSNYAYYSKDNPVFTDDIFDIIKDVNPNNIGLIKVDIEGGDEDVFEELKNLILMDGSIDFSLDTKLFKIPVRDLYMKKDQTHKIKGQGISRICEKDIYNVSLKGDLFVNIVLE